MIHLVYMTTVVTELNCFESICNRIRDTIISLNPHYRLERQVAYLVKNGRPLICGSELHSIITQTLFRAFRTTLVTLLNQL